MYVHATQKIFLHPKKLNSKFKISFKKSDENNRKFLKQKRGNLVVFKIRKCRVL